MSLPRISFVAWLLASAVGCSSGGADRDSAANSEDELRGGRVSLGGECTERRRCKDGLSCRMQPPPPCGATAGGCPPATSICVEDENGGTVRDPGEVVTNGNVTKHYYEVIAPSVIWKAGCGMRRLDGQPCERGLFVEFKRKYSDLTTTRSVTVDNDARTMTVKLTTWSTKDEHPRTPTEPEKLQLEDEDVQHSTEYATKIVDRNGREIWAGTIETVLAQ